MTDLEISHVMLYSPREETENIQRICFDKIPQKKIIHHLRGR